MHLTYAKKYVIKYASASAFQGSQQPCFMDLLNEHDCDVLAEDGELTDYTNNFSVPKSDIRRLVKELENSEEREECGLQVEDVLSLLRAALRDTKRNRDSEIHFSWF